MKHTPGPWEYAKTAAGFVDIITSDDNMLGTIFPRDRQEANARLIAAAPDLLALAERVKDIATRACEGGFTEWDDFMDAKALELEAIAAIARAKGETE